jgi:hypothetical protein
MTVSIARLGKETVDKGMRFYLVTGMNHCMGGDGTFLIDWLGALKNWGAEAALRVSRA